MAYTNDELKEIARQEMEVQCTAIDIDNLDFEYDMTQDEIEKVLNYVYGSTVIISIGD